MAERLKAAVLKTASPERRRGFESLSLRHLFLPASLQLGYNTERGEMAERG